MNDSAPRSDLIEEAGRIVGAAAEQEVVLRVLGGVAVRLRTPSGLHPAVERSYLDIDLVAEARKGRRVATLMRELGYQPNSEFNAVNGHRRLLFYDTVNERQVDIFVGGFAMCHVIPIADRLTLDETTVPLAELLLTKLQVVQLNEKDQRDILALFYHHDVADADGDSINGAYVASACAADWGLWRTSTLNLDRTIDALPEYGFTDAERELIARRVGRLRGDIEIVPKRATWKLRSRVGDRVQWYEEPEEVG